MTERRVSVGDHDLPIEEHGAGTPLIWGHGLSSSRKRENAFPLVRFGKLAESCRVIRYDARGHGTAGGPDDPAAYEWPNLATDQLALADALGLDSYIAAGISMGTATALHVAVRAPERIKAMVLTAPPTAWGTRAAQADTYRASAAFIEKYSPRKWAEESPRNPLFADLPLEAVIPDIPVGIMPTVFRGAAASDLPDEAEIEKLDVPVFIQAWAHDPGHPESTARRLHEILPSSSLYVARNLLEFKGWTSRIKEFVDGL